MPDQISVQRAYAAMLRFLEAYYDRTGADEIGALVGGLAMDEDGQPMDPAAWNDWLVAVAEARAQGSLGDP